MRGVGEMGAWEGEEGGAGMGGGAGEAGMADGVGEAEGAWLA